MAASVRSVNVDNVKRLVGAVRIGDGFDMDKSLRAASDIGGDAPETNRRDDPDGRSGDPDDIERFECVARWMGLKEPEAEILFNLTGNRIRLPTSTRQQWRGVPGSSSHQLGPRTSLTAACGHPAQARSIPVEKQRRRT